MADEQAPPAGPDLTQGIALSDFTGETLLGHVGDQDVLLVRAGPEIFAIDAHCSHYHGPLAEGLVVGDSIRCPWHHACFDLRTGEAARAPALTPLAVRRALQRRRCCGGRNFAAPSSCSVTIARRRSTGQICQRIILPVARRRIGCRCVRTAFTPKPASTFG